MVSGKHSKTYDINKIHEFIDNLTFPTGQSTPTYLEAHQKLRQKKLFDEPSPPEKRIAPTVRLTRIESEIPEGIVQTNHERQKQEATTVSTQPPAPATDTLFPTEGARQVEQPNPEPAPSDHPTTEPSGLKEPTVLTPPIEQTPQKTPGAEPSTPVVVTTETNATESTHPKEEPLPEFEPVDETPAPSPEDHDWLSEYEPLEVETIWDKNLTKETAPEPRSFEEVTPEAPEPTPSSPREERREQKHRQKELKQRLKLEKQAAKRQERETRRQEKKDQKQQRSESLPAYRKPSRWQRQNQIIKHARERERSQKQQEKLYKKNELISTGLRENAYKRRLREDKRLKKSKDREKRHDNADIISRKAPEPPKGHAPVLAPEPQKSIREQQVAQETKERQTLKDLEHDLQKEKETKEKEARKAKAIEEEKAKKAIEARYEEERRSQRNVKPGTSIDVFNGFDSIDQATALTLYTHGYTTVERLLSATVEDLMKIGIKKKIANLICAETKEFVEWKVFDAKEEVVPVAHPADKDEEPPQQKK